MVVAAQVMHALENCIKDFADALFVSLSEDMKNQTRESSYNDVIT
jgi:hypothetical protein